jgi:ClpX C4-type zinc finger
MPSGGVTDGAWVGNFSRYDHVRSIRIGVAIRVCYCSCRTNCGATIFLTLEMARQPPPLVIDSARVVSYAYVDDIPYRRWGSLFAGGKLLEHVPRLAICMNLGEDIGPLLYHCGENWIVLGTSGRETIEATKRDAEQNYPGVASRWVDLDTSVDEALSYYDEQSGNLRCSFCSKRPFEMQAWVEGAGAVICRQCVEQYHQDFQSASDDSP